MASIKVDQIVAYLKTQSTVTNVVGERIFFGEPMREQTGVYLVLNIVSQRIENTVSKQCLVEFRIVGNDENVTKQSIISLGDILDGLLVTNDNSALYTLGTFVVYKIVEGGTYRVLVDDKNRNIMIKDYIFYFLS